jgi:hypothetical protein
MADNGTPQACSAGLLENISRSSPWRRAQTQTAPLPARPTGRFNKTAFAACKSVPPRINPGIFRDSGSFRHRPDPVFFYTGLRDFLDCPLLFAVKSPHKEVLMKIICARSRNCISFSSGLMVLIILASWGFPFQSAENGALSDLAKPLRYTFISRQRGMGSSVLCNPDQPLSGQPAEGRR